VARGDLSTRNVHPEIRTKGIQFAPTNRAFAVACTDGLLVYSLDDSLTFDPFELGEVSAAALRVCAPVQVPLHAPPPLVSPYLQDVTPDAVDVSLSRRHFARALLVALHLNERTLVLRVCMSTPRDAVAAVLGAVPVTFLETLLTAVAEQLVPGPAASLHLDFFVHWLQQLLSTFRTVLAERQTMFAGALRSAQRGLLHHRESLLKMCVPCVCAPVSRPPPHHALPLRLACRVESNASTLEFLTEAAVATTSGSGSGTLAE
jgi:periodic tryptophan protein 2